MAYIYFYIKFCEQRSYADDFVAGRLYLNPLSCFRNWEGDGDGRADRYEAPSEWRQPNDVTIEFAGYKLASEEMTFPVVIQEGHHDLINLLCLYAGSTGDFGAITDQNFEAFRRYMQVPAECSKMGEWAVLVRNVVEFERRFDGEIRRRGYGLRRGRVSYFDGDAFSGTVEHPLFWKRQEFAWQREYRFAVNTRAVDPAPLVLDVGNLSDICTIVTFERLAELTITPKKDGSGPGA